MSPVIHAKFWQWTTTICIEPLALLNFPAIRALHCTLYIKCWADAVWRSYEKINFNQRRKKQRNTCQVQSQWWNTSEHIDAPLCGKNLAGGLQREQNKHKSRVIPKPKTWNKKSISKHSVTQIITVDAPNGRSLSLHLKAVKRLLYMQNSWHNYMFSNKCYHECSLLFPFLGI